MILIQICLEVRVGQLISIFKFTIFWRRLLNSVISQMHKLIWQILQTEFPWRCAQVALFIVVSFHVSIDRSNQSESANIKLSFVHQQRVSNVFLNYTSAPFRFCCLRYKCFNLTKIICDRDTHTSIRIFTWFDDPSIWLTFICFKSMFEFLELFIFEWLDMEGNGQNSERILSQSFIIEPHIQK